MLDSSTSGAPRVHAVSVRSLVEVLNFNVPVHVELACENQAFPHE